MQTKQRAPILGSNPDPPLVPLLDGSEKFLTYRQAAAELNVPYHVIQQAARKCVIPTWKLMGARRYVRIVDILAVMKAD